MKKNKNQLIISAIVGVAIAVLCHQTIIKLKIENANLKKLTDTSTNAPIKTIVYAVSKIDLKKGDKIIAANLSTKRFPIEIEGAVTDFTKIEGLEIKKDLKADTPILESYFNASKIAQNAGEPRSGYGAAGLTISKESLPSFVQEGSYVDIYCAKDTIRAKNIRVLSITDTLSGGSKYVLLEIKEKDIPAFIGANATDKMVFVQRNRLDEGSYKFMGGALSSIPTVDSASDLVEIPEISADEPPRSQQYRPKTPSGFVPAAYNRDVPVVKSAAKESGEIELITGDKKMIVGTP